MGFLVARKPPSTVTSRSAKLSVSDKHEIQSSLKYIVTVNISNKILIFMKTYDFVSTWHTESCLLNTIQSTQKT